MTKSDVFEGQASSKSNGYNRRRFLRVCAAAGVGGTLLPGVLLGMAEGQVAGGAGVSSDATRDLPTITPEMIVAAAGLAGISLSEEQTKVMVEGLTSQRESVSAIRGLKMENGVAPAVIFDPVPGGMVLDRDKRPLRMSPSPNVSRLAPGAPGASGSAGSSREELLAYATVRELAELVRTRKVSAVDLTKLYLGRLKKYDPELHFVITLTEDRAMRQAEAADSEIAAGRYRGPLHGIPWGAKDLLAVKGYRTTWGAGGFEQQAFDYDATVVERLDAAGAVLVAKLSMGALAQGDLWFGARTRNPWNKRQGSSGSSAGSASATAAGCVGFAIGTETLGSISSPSTRVGATGLRPSFGLVPRTGAMALSWTMDKIGPICRSVEDCALVLSAIYGQDGKDLSVQPAAFNWNAEYDWKALRVGYIASAFKTQPPREVKAPAAGASAAEQAEYAKRVQRAKDNAVRQEYDLKFAQRALETLRNMGVNLRPVEIPEFPFGAIVPVLQAEGAAAFDDLTRSGRDKLLTGQQPFDWPNTFRVARFYSAVDYIQAMRARTLAIAKMAELFQEVDVIVTPSGGTQLVATNLTGQPAVIVPNGLRGESAPKSVTDEDGALENAGGPGTPVSLTFLGGLYTEARLAAFARAYQEVTGFHLVHPRLV